MFRPRIIPVLLLKNRGLVKTIKFNKSKARYIGDPINAVRIFNDLESDELVFLDITATKENRTVSVDLVRQIGDEAYMPFAVGGGIKNSAQARELVSVGAEKVVINTLFAQNPGEVEKAAALLGNQSIIVSIDVKKDWRGRHKVATYGGSKLIKTSVHEYAKKAEEYGAGEIILNSIDRDGTYSGYELDLVSEISSNIGIPVIAIGGAADLSDLKTVTADSGASAAAAGSLFVFHGPRKAVLVNYPEKQELLDLFKK